MLKNLKTPSLAPQTALPPLLVRSRRVVTACSRVIPAKWPNTPLPSQESMDLPKPPSSELTSSPTKNTKILPPPPPPSRSLTSPRMNTKLLTSMKTTISLAPFWKTDPLKWILNFPLKMKKLLELSESCGKKEETKWFTWPSKKPSARKNGLPEDTKNDLTSFITLPCPITLNYYLSSFWDWISLFSI